MSLQKENFLRSKLIPYLQQLPPATIPLWGKMNVQQMIEHLSDAVQIANGRLVIEESFTPAEQLPAMQEFVMSNRSFKKNIKNPLVGENPAPLRYITSQAAIAALHAELIYFFEHFSRNPDHTTHNPFFGHLNFEQNVSLLHKHALHHLSQFGVVPLTS